MFRAATGHLYGPSHPRARLTSEDVSMIRLLRAEGMAYREIAEKFEAPLMTICNICLLKTRVYE